MKKFIVPFAAALRCASLLSQTFSAPVAIDPNVVPPPNGLHTSCTVVDGRPATSSVNPLTDSVIYCIANDSFGQFWTRKSLAHLPSFLNGSTSINIINNNPAIAYTDPGSNAVYFMSSNDSLGNNWGVSHLVDSFSAAQECKLIILNGKPAIAYWDGNVQCIKFSVANNATGNLWVPPSVPVSNVSPWFDVIVVNGKPAFAYVDGTGLNYMLAQDSLGQSWLPPVNIVSSCGVPSLSLAIVDGFPAIAFQDGPSYNLSYRRALDSNGSSWGPSIITSITALGGFYCKLAVHNNQPIISYTMDNEEVYLITANDPLGNTWNQEVLVHAINPTFDPAISIIDLHNFLGVVYYDDVDTSAYFVRACIAPLPPAVSGTSTICSGSSTVLSTSGVGNVSWYTSPTNGIFLTSTDSFITPALNTSTTYYVQDSTCAASSRAAVTVTVNPPPTLTLTGNTTICNGDSTQLTVNGNGDTFTWSTGSNAMTETYAPSTTLPAFVTTADGNGCTSALSFTVTVIQPVTVTQNLAICQNDFVLVGTSMYSTAGTYVDTLGSAFGCDSIITTLLTVQPLIDTSVSYSSGTLTSMENGAVYQWINCQNMQSINGATNQDFTPAQNGTYAVIIGNGPCTDTSSCITVTDVGVAAYEQQAINLHCTTDENSISGLIIGCKSEILISIFDATGQLVYSENTTRNEFHAHVECAGVYMVHIQCSEGELAQQVIVQ